MADDGSENDGGKETGGGKGVLGDLVKAESMLQLAIALPAGCLIGWLAGSWLDRHFHQEWISIAGIVLGAIGGFIQIFTVASKFLKKDQS
jgi:F0F1-type ATP synthase assembly protein I